MIGGPLIIFGSILSGGWSLSSIPPGIMMLVTVIMNLCPAGSVFRRLIRNKELLFHFDQVAALRIERKSAQIDCIQSLGAVFYSAYYLARNALISAKPPAISTIAGGMKFRGEYQSVALFATTKPTPAIPRAINSHAIIFVEPGSIF